MTTHRVEAAPSSHAIPGWAQAALAAPSTSRHIEVDGCRIHYLSWGSPDRPPLVLVHGNAAHAEWWRFIAPLLADDYYVLAPDLGGMGDSAHCGRYARERYAEQVLSVAAAAAPGRPPFLVGHSRGGFVSLMAGTARGDELAGIIIVDCAIDAPERSTAPLIPPFKATAEVFPDRHQALRRFRLVPEQPVGCPFYLEHSAWHSLTEAPGGWRWKCDLAAISHPRPTDFSAQLLSLPCPKALFIGEHSSLMNGPVRPYMRATFGPLMPVVELPNCHHHVMLDEPLLLVSALRTQLANWRVQTLR